MGNRVGYGIFGVPRDVANPAPLRPATQILAVRAGEQLFSPVTAVYQWCHSRWELVWASGTAPPSNVVATWQPGVTNVLVTWVEPALNTAESYALFRPDGTPVDTVHLVPGMTSATDYQPNFAPGTYKLQSVAAAGNSPLVAAPTLPIDLSPATAVATLQGNSQATVTWTPRAQGDPETWRIQQAEALPGDYLTGHINGTVHSWVIPTRPAWIYQFRIWPFLDINENGEGPYSRGKSTDTQVVFTAPNVPTNPTLTSPAPDVLRLTFAAPIGGGQITRYEVQGNDAGTGWVNVDLNNTSGLVDWSTQTVSGQMRVRAIAFTGASSLASAYVVAGPIAAQVPAPTIISLSVQPSGVGRFIVATPSTDAYCAEYYWANFPGWRAGPFLSTGSSTAQCQTGDPFVNGDVWWDFERLQNSPTYAHVQRVRGGGAAASVWVQAGPV